MNQEMSLDIVQVDPFLSMAEGRPLLRDETTYRNAIARNANRYSDKMAVISDHENLSKSFRELFDDCCNLAENLVAICDLKHGDHVAIATGNCYNYLVSFLACAIKGLIVWDYDPSMAPHEVDRYVETVKPSAIFTLGLKSPQHVYFPNMAAIITKLQLMGVKVMAIDGESYNMVNSYFIEDLLAPNENGGPNGQRTKPDDPLLLWSTSGSTGTPKRVMWSNRNMIALEKMYSVIFGLTLDDKFCIPLSLHHCYGQVVLRASLFSGDRVILTGYKYSAGQAISCLIKYECSFIALVPTMLSDVLDHMVNRNLQLKLTKIMLAGSALNQATANRMAAILPGIASHQLYGLSEMDVAGIITKTRFDTAGQPLPNTKVKVVDDDGQIVPHGQEGRLLVNSKIGMMGYLKKDGSLDTGLDKDGYFDTGDLFKMDAEGYLYYQNRVKDVIDRGGFKVSPKEVENVLLAIPGVIDCVVLGIPDARLGEQVVAIVHVNTTLDMTETELLALASSMLSKPKMPRRVHISTEKLPRVTSLKHDKNALRALVSQISISRI